MVVALWTSTPTSMTVVEMRTSIWPAAKARIVRSFSSGGSLPCSIAVRRPCERSPGELLVEVLDGGERHLLRGDLAVLVDVELVALALLQGVAADPGADDVHLMALADLLAHPLPHPADPRRLVDERHDVGLDRRPAGRQLGEHRGLEVTEDGHRDGARDRGRGHHQDVRRRAGLVGQRGALLHAEAVLLVDHHEAEVGERDRLLEERVGADHDASLPTPPSVRARGPWLPWTSIP